MTLFMYSILPGAMERKFVINSCLKRGTWGLLELYTLLTDDIVNFNMRPEGFYWDVLNKQVTAAGDKNVDYKQHPDLCLSLLIAKCPVSIMTMTKTKTITRQKQ